MLENAVNALKDELNALEDDSDVSGNGPNVLKLASDALDCP